MYSVFPGLLGQLMFGDVSETNSSLGPRDPKLMGHAEL